MEVQHCFELWGWEKPVVTMKTAEVTGLRKEVVRPFHPEEGKQEQPVGSAVKHRAGHLGLWYFLLGCMGPRGKSGI